MHFKSDDLVFTNRLEKHFVKFIEEMNLIQGKPLLVGVSGGVDSMALMFLLFKCGYSTRSCFIHHNTRIGQDEEEKLVQSFSEHLQIPFYSEKVLGLRTDKNFESEARKKRYDVFEKIRNDDELVAIAHHIDDSFEWSLMQNLKTSNLKACVGIPLVNRNLIRPLMCLTKAQIIRYAKAYDLPFLEDPTNAQIKYERNFLRSEVISAFKDRHPQYLKHYVNKQNELARLLGVHRVLSAKNSFQISFQKNAVCIYSLKTEIDFSGLDEVIVRGIKYLNPNDRGSLHNQIEKIKQGMLNNKFGPLTMVKGLKLYLSFNHILICNDDFKVAYPDLAEINYQVMNLSEFKTELNRYVFKGKVFPLFVAVDKKSRWISFSKRDYPLNSSFAKSIREKNLTYQAALNLLAQWSKPKNQNKLVNLSFLVRL